MATQKADFTEVYYQPDPRAYYEALGALDYEIPTHGRNVFDVVLDEIRDDDEAPTVLDLCCSYGVNAALLNHDLTLDEVQHHYASAASLPRTALVDHDREWFGARRRDDAVDVLGLDISQPAIDYAVEAGLLADGVVADLEATELRDVDAEKLATVDLITVTGGVGYVNERTFEQVLGAVDDPPWVAALSLRWVDFEPIAEVLDSHGLVTEKVDGFVVPQRRFANDNEQQFVMDRLDSQGLAPTAIERNGQHGAELYVARPADGTPTTTLDEVLTELI